MNKNLSLGISIGVFVIAIVGLILGYLAMTSEVPNAVTGEMEPDQAAIDRALYFTYFAIILGLAGWIIFSIWKIIQNPKSFIVTGIGIVVFGIILFIAYSVAKSGTADAMTWVTGEDATESNIINSSTGLITTYVTLTIAVLTIMAGLVMGLMRYFKK